MSAVDNLQSYLTNLDTFVSFDETDLDGYSLNSQGLAKVNSLKIEGARRYLLYLQQNTLLQSEYFNVSEHSVQNSSKNHIKFVDGL